MTRAERAAEQLEGLDLPDVDTEEFYDELDRYLLVEYYPISRHQFVTTHATMQDAASYHLSQEDPGWFIEELVDLDTGDSFLAYSTIYWRPA